MTSAPAAAARRGARLRALAPRWGAVVVALAALAGTAAGRVPVPGERVRSTARAAAAATAAASATAAATGAPHKLLRADVMVVAQQALPARDVARVARLRGVAGRPGGRTRPGSG